MSTLFDDVSRIIASPVSRRKMLGLIGGAVGGAVLASFGLQAAALDENNNMPKCGTHQTLCGKTCCDPGHACCDGKCCGSKCVCCNGRCCDSDDVCCDGRCVEKRASKNGRCPPDND